MSRFLRQMRGVEQTILFWSTRTVCWLEHQPPSTIGKDRRYNCPLRCATKLYRWYAINVNSRANTKSTMCNKCNKTSVANNKVWSKDKLKLQHQQPRHTNSNNKIIMSHIEMQDSSPANRVMLLPPLLLLLLLLLYKVSSLAQRPKVKVAPIPVAVSGAPPTIAA